MSNTIRGGIVLDTRKKGMLAKAADKAKKTVKGFVEEFAGEKEIDQDVYAKQEKMEEK